MQLTLAPFSIGAIVQDRYKVEAVLGTGGFSIVYLVRDLHKTTAPETVNDALFALKELRNQDQHERVRFAFEGDVLRRLQHPSLPRVYDVCEKNEEQRSFLVLEYIQGSNLEILRKQKESRRFSVSEMMSLMEPIMDATAYLHRQQPPIIHRDIKPANIIVTNETQHAYLVDFGIAKEYEIDATTTAIRHCSPGYGAPEQYGNLGTDVRADIYALGATCYCLLTGTVPIDAFQRTTTLVSKGSDPLKPISEFVSDVPPHIVQALHRAMMIGYEQRFLCIEDFWDALQKPSDPPSEGTSSPVTRSTEDLPAEIHISKKRSRHKVSSHHQKRRRPLLQVLLILFIVAGLGSGFWAYTSLNQHPKQTDTLSKTTQHRIATQQPSPDVQSHYPLLATNYKGSLSDLLNQTTSNITLTDIRQNQQSISGRFTGLHIIEGFTGVLDASKHIFLTVPATAKQPALFFEGTVRSDGTLVGNYCNQDPAGQCTGNYGLWRFVPEMK